jgi:histidinol phosphatase-like enzyme
MKIVILDRDGVINQDNINHIKNPNEWIPIPKSLEADINPATRPMYLEFLIIIGLNN